MIKEFFFLNRECIIVRGETKASIYNLYNRKVYLIDLDLYKLLSACESEKLSIDEILDINKFSNKTELLNELTNLYKLGLGTFFDKRVIIEKVRSPFQKFKRRESFKAVKLDKLTIELTNECNLNCYFCRKEQHKISKCGCWRHEGIKNENLSLESWIKIIESSMLFDCNSIKIVGGEPFLYKDNLILLLNFLYDQKIDYIEIFTNGALLTEKIIRLLNYHTNLIIPFYSSNKKLHETITGNKDSYHKILENIKKLINYKVNFRIDLIITDINYHNSNKTYNFLKKMGFKNVNKTYLNTEHFKRESNVDFPFLVKPSTKNFYKYKEGHPCWDGQLAITFEGDILPCIMARKHKIAHINNKTLREVLTGKDYYKYWDLSKDKIDGCKNCELRYACFDCRILHSYNSNLTEKNEYCDYQ